VPALAPLLCHEDDFVRLQSATALGKIGVRDIKVLINALDAALDGHEDRMAESLVIALCETGEKSDDVYAAFVDAFFRGGDRVREKAKIGIRKIDPTAQIRQNRKSLTMKTPGRIAAAILRKRWGLGQQQ
jgi:hypothetical protein